MSVKTQNELALASVKVIYDAANEAQAEAERAHSAADDAATAASAAQTQAGNAATAASNAQTAAENASKTATAALDQLGIVEDVIGVLTWASEHGTFTLTADTTVQDGKVYFTYDSATGDYVPVVTPAADPHAAGYYELSVDEAMDSFIMSHLAVTSRGLWVLPNGMGSASDAQYAPNYKVLLSNNGMYVYDGSGALVSTFGENITFSAARGQRIGGASNYIEFDPTTGRINIIGSGVYFGTTPVGDVATQSDIPTKVSDLNNDAGFITNSDVPTKVSDLTNDSGYQTSAEVDGKIDESIIPVLDNIADVQTHVSDIDETIGTQEQSISDLQTATSDNAASISSQADAIASLQTEQTTISNSITNINEETHNLDVRTTALEKGVVIDPNEPSVSVVQGNSSVKVTSARVTIKGTGNSVAWGDSESFNAQKGVFTEIRPRTMTISGSTVTLSGNLVLIARTNGHVSLKRML